ncbi:MAG TPA: helix-turn-helix transcriptional regulator [Puia sp.]
MNYQEIIPGSPLRQYVKHYYIYESESAATFDDTVFPSGCMEIIFNLGSGQWQTAPSDSDFITHPPIELWGQITRPLPVRSIGKNTMLGIRFFPHSAAYFLREQMDRLNNQVLDALDVSGENMRELHSRLLETATWKERIRLIEEFLQQSLLQAENRLNKVALVSNVMNELRKEDFFDNIDNVASRYGITSRYLQKLFLQHTGLTPKLYSKINRFQHSLRLITQKNLSLTDVTYDCGYFDQSHFIREFKSFTGLTPSGYAQDSSPITLALV